MATIDAQSSGIQAPSGGFQQGGWYWDPTANAARQYMNGSFGDPSSIHPESSQPGAGQPVSPQFKPSTPLSTSTTQSGGLPSTNKGTGISTNMPGLTPDNTNTNTPNTNTGTLPSTMNTPTANTSATTTTTNPNQAASQAIANGADPSDIANARKYLNDKDFIGYCQAFVEKATGSGWQGQSAIDAWNRQIAKQQTNMSNIKPGDTVYFAPDQSNGNNGHTGIYTGNGNFISATDNGVQEMNLGDWIKETGQKLLGFLVNPNSPGAVGGGNNLAANVMSNIGGAEKAAGNAVNWLGNEVNNIKNKVIPTANASTKIPSQALNANVLPSGTPTWLQDTIVKAANKYDVPPSILASVAAYESGGTFNPRLAQTGGGMGRGMFQIDIGQNNVTEQEAFDPQFAADFAAKMLKEGYDKTGNWADALRYYNGGPGFDSNKIGYGGQTVNANTNTYADRVAKGMSNLTPYVQEQANKMTKDLVQKKATAKNDLESRFPILKNLSSLQNIAWPQG